MAGSPTEDQWIQKFRNLENFTLVRHLFIFFMGITFTRYFHILVSVKWLDD